MTQNLVTQKPIQLIQGDCLVESERIKTGSVDLILTDLPYGTIKGLNGDAISANNDKGYVGGGGYKKNTLWDTKIETGKIMKIANRVLRKNGKMVLFAQQPFTTELINKALPNVPHSYNMIWEKDNFANCLLSKKAPVSYVEDILIFSKKNEFEGLHPLRDYFKKIYEFIGTTKKHIVQTIGHRADHTFRFNSSQFDLCTRDTYTEIVEIFGVNEMKDFKDYDYLQGVDIQFKKKFASTFNLWQGKKYKSNILKYKKDYDGYHPTQKPVLLLEDLIKTFSNEWDLVVDLTMGSGSTMVACRNTNRRGIGIEMNKDYYNISLNRLEETKAGGFFSFL